MKRMTQFSPLALSALLILTLGLQSCIQDRCDQTITYLQYTPIYMPEAEFLDAVEVQAPRALVEPGKIYAKGDILFVNEIGQGVHIFDNADPSQPVPMAFLRVPGNYDLSTACDKLYLDSSTDLLVFDIGQADRPRFLHRVKNALPHIVEYRGFTADPSQGVVVAWEEQVITQDYSCEGNIPSHVLANQVDPGNVDPALLNNTRTVNPATPGKAGSMSRFVVQDDYLYTVAPRDLQVFDLGGCDYPTRVATASIDLPWGGEAEMVTTLEDNLLIGGTNGMAIYSIATPTNPEYLSTFQHAQACDPVAAQNGIAYVTLRSENSENQPCGNNFTNQLDVVNIRNPYAPHLIGSFRMNNPHGVGIDGNLLFVADGEAGLKVFDASMPSEVGNHQLAHFEEMFGFDVIPYQQLLIMTGKDGISMYDYSDPRNLRRLSVIPVSSE